MRVKVLTSLVFSVPDTTSALIGNTNMAILLMIQNNNSYRMKSEWDFGEKVNIFLVGNKRYCRKLVTAGKRNA